MKGYIVTVLDDYGNQITKFKTKTGIRGRGKVIVEIIDDKANVYNI